MRMIIAIVAGLFTSLLIILIGWMIRSNLYPLPDGLDITNSAEYAAYIQTLPDRFFVIGIIMCVVSAFAGSLISSLIPISGRYQAGIITGLLFFTILCFYVIRDHLPTWYVVTCLGLTAIACFSGAIYGGSRKL
jgi:hypothetical protein